MMSFRECERDVKRMKMSAGHRIGFRTKSEVEILDDGFKWRKYGKKSVKNSPNPRYNFYAFYLKNELEDKFKFMLMF